MAVTVVGQDSQVAKRATCFNCGSILQYYPKDVDSRIEHDYGGGSDHVRFIKCPTCAWEVSVK